MDFAMPDSLDPQFAAAPLPLSSDERHARDETELVHLRATVVNLLEEIKRGANSVMPVPDMDENGMAPRTEFVSMLSHELRNPLQSMAMAIRMLAPTARVNPAVAQAHGVLERQMGHISRLLDDLLDASRVASGKIILQLATVSLRDVIDAALETSRPDLQLRQQTLAIDLPDEDIALTGDLIRLAQAVSNLLINASQFTPTQARIGVAAVCRDEMIDITVSDNGAGIPLALQPFIFDLFTQGHRTLERALGGLGLGLALVQTIVRMHGGSVTVKSDGAGTGSSFTISLPLAPAAAPPLQAPATQAAAMRNILIIEDNVDANEIMAILLSMQGHQVTSSFHGADGLRLALDGQFDVVVCDLGLPGLSGLEVAAAIKASHPGAAPVVIAMSGYTDSSQRDLARAAGFDHYLTKPVDLALLYQLIAGNAV